MEYTLVLKEDLVQRIVQALAEQPYKFSAPVMVELQRQIQEQQKPNLKVVDKES